MKVSPRTYNELRLLARLIDPVIWNHKPGPDGMIDIEFPEATVERLDLVRMEGESDDDVVSRLIAFHNSGGKAN